MTSARTVALSLLLKTLESEAECVRKIRDTIAIALEDDARIEDLQELYAYPVGKMLEMAKSQAELAALTESEVVTAKAAALVSQLEAVYRLVQ